MNTRHIERDGHTIAVQEAGHGPPVVILPAMGTPAWFYDEFMNTLADLGYRVLVMDWRGNGASHPAPRRGDRYGYAELAGDLRALLTEIGSDDVTVIGHSLGGQIATIAVATGETRISRIVLVAVGLPFFRDYPGRNGLILLPYTQAIGLTSRILGVWPGWTFGGRQSAGLMTDWAHTARTGELPPISGHRPDLARVTTPLLAVSVANDSFTPHATVRRLLDRMPHAPVTELMYTDKLAGGPVDHMRWAKVPHELSNHIASFIKEN